MKNKNTIFLKEEIVKIKHPEIIEDAKKLIYKTSKRNWIG